MAYCNRCDRYFPHFAALHQHERDSSAHNICGDCNIDYSTWTMLKEHWVQSPRHHYCQYCSEHFADDDDLEEHYQSSHFYCGSCRRVFKNDVGLHEHYRQSPNHDYCASCKRLFQSERHLRTHLESSIHRPRDVPCPFRGCDAAFVSRSALILHLESGGCRSRVDRATINRFVLQYDKNHVITNPSRLITGGNSAQDVKYYASEASWNGSMYECYLCHRTYSTLVALNQHLSSPRHEQKIYLCPPGFCRMQFRTLSALCQHIESGTCGVSKFKAVQDAMDSIVGMRGWVTF